MVDNLQELGALAKMFRDKAGLTQGALASKVDTNRSAIAHLEQGLRLPDTALLRRVCEFLAIPEPLWVGFVPTASPYAVALRCRCATSSSRADAQRKALSFEDSASRLKAKFPELFINRRFVPVPRSLRTRAHRLEEWSSYLLARAMADAGSLCTVERLLERHTVIRRSSDPRDPTRDRPGIDEHRRTLRLTSAELPPGLVLVDDFVTYGSTLMACASLIVDRGRGGEVDALVGDARSPDVTPTKVHTLVFAWNRDTARPLAIAD